MRAQGQVRASGHLVESRGKRARAVEPLPRLGQVPPEKGRKVVGIGRGRKPM